MPLLHDALAWYAGRERRYGAVPQTQTQTLAESRHHADAKSPDRTGVAAFTAGASLVRPDTVVVSDVGRDRPGDGLGMDGVHGLGRAARVARGVSAADRAGTGAGDRKSTRLNSSH